VGGYVHRICVRVYIRPFFLGVIDIVMGNSDKQMELIADLDNAKYKIINLQHKNKALEDRIQELENENRWLKIFGDKSRRIK